MAAKWHSAAIAVTPNKTGNATVDYFTGNVSQREP